MRNLRSFPRYTAGCFALVAALFAADSTAIGDEAESAGEDSKRKTVRLVEMDWKGVQKLVASHKGKVVVVDIWTTTCPVCLTKFPKFVALQKTFGEKAACVSLNCDYDGIPDKPPKYYRDNVLKFLRKQNATFDNVLLTMPFLAFLNKIKLESTPAVLVYDRSGKLVKRFDNDKAVKEADEFTMKQVTALVGKLVRSRK